MAEAIALLPFAGTVGSKFVGPSTFTARHEASLRREEQRIDEKIAQLNPIHAEHGPPVEDSLAFGQLLKE